METNKHAGGRPPKFKTPEELAEKAEGYFKWCDEHPVRIYQRKNAGASDTAASGKGVRQDEGTMLVDRPYTLDGLGLWCGLASWKDFRAYHSDDEFSAVIRTLEARVRDQQVTGGLCGVYHPNLTARLNGISESLQVEGNIPVQLIDDGMNDD